MTIDPEAFEYAISKIDDGFIFEVFVQAFLSGLIGYEFIPVGGSKDKGIDGILHISRIHSDDKTIIQTSTESNIKGKIEDTILKLNKNGVKFTRLRYVTNRNVSSIDLIIEELFSKYEKQITINDIKWLTSNCNDNEAVINSYRVFSDKYLYEYKVPGNVKVVANLDEDPRLFVFLRQQFDSKRVDIDLDDLLVDALIIYSLEGTDPDKCIFLKKDLIKEKISKYIKFDIRLLDEKIEARLDKLSTKPRKIKHHQDIDSYCLPYKTRLEVQDRNLKDEKLNNMFIEEIEVFMKNKFKLDGLIIRNISGLITKVINHIFYKQGLEFSNFVLNGDTTSTLEQNLQEVISNAVDQSSIIPSNKEKAKEIVMISIREAVYNGSENQSRYLKSLSKTYLMMFMLHWEPKISVYFHTLASELKLFVDNSIIIPALSEFYLETKNRRHWNLLKGAKNAGITMFINDTLLRELITHLNMVKVIYEKYYQDTEDFYLSDNYDFMYIDEILIRAYFYAKKRGLVENFYLFIDNFIDPSAKNIKEEMVEYLKEEFGIIHISNELLDIKIDEKELVSLVNELKIKKSNEEKAKNDAEMILSIYYLRAKGNETSESGIFGYKTWWLSKDTNTYCAVENVFNHEKYEISCYIRPDFIYNYISLMPSEAEVRNAYGELFPTMLGVNLSYHMPLEITRTVQAKLLDFKSKSPIRVRQILKNLSNRLKTDPSLRTKEKIVSYFDEELLKLKHVGD